MTIQIQIDRVVLDGLPVTAREGREIRQAIEQELARLLAVRGLSSELERGAARPRMHAGTLQLEAGAPPARLGADIARAIHEGIGASEERPTNSAKIAGPRGVAPRGVAR